MNFLVKSSPPVRRVIGGMRMSFTSELTIAPKAAPIMTPIARSTALPLIANSLNSLNIGTRPLLGCDDVNKLIFDHDHLPYGQARDELPDPFISARARLQLGIGGGDRHHDPIAHLAVDLNCDLDLVLDQELGLVVGPGLGCNLGRPDREFTPERLPQFRSEMWG